MFRIGQGFDAHAFGSGNHVVLGGVRIPHTNGISAHSDGDVLCHAVGEALLGAAALGDLGEHFPATEKWKGASGLELLSHIDKLLAAHAVRVVNVDATIIAQAPKLAPHVPLMRHFIADAVHLSPEYVSVKSTTTDMLGFTGRGEGIAVLANALIMENAKS